MQKIKYWLTIINNNPESITSFSHFVVEVNRDNIISMNVCDIV